MSVLRVRSEAGVLVCSACSRDIVAPPSLIEERDDLLRKLEDARDELARTRNEIAQGPHFIADDRMRGRRALLDGRAALAGVAATAVGSIYAGLKGVIGQ